MVTYLGNKQLKAQMQKESQLKSNLIVYIH